MLYSHTGQIGKLYRPRPTHPHRFVLLILALYLTLLPATRITYTAEAREVGYSLQERLTVVAECESDSTHYDAQGNALRGILRADVGIMQINENVWSETAQRLGYDLEDEHDNASMARWIALNDSRGFENWSASYDYENNTCWKYE